MKFPVLVKLIAVLHFVSAFSLSLGGFLLAMLGIVLITTTTGALGTYGPSLVTGFGIAGLALGVLQFFVARGLWFGHNWSRIAAVIISLFLIAVSSWGLVVAPPERIIWGLLFIFSLLVAGYLWISDGVRNSFS